MVNLIVDEMVIRGSDGIECFLFKKDSKKLNEIIKTLLMNLMIQNLELPLRDKLAIKNSDGNEHLFVLRRFYYTYFVINFYFSTNYNR